MSEHRTERRGLRRRVEAQAEKEPLDPQDPEEPFTKNEMWSCTLLGLFAVISAALSYLGRKLRTDSTWHRFLKRFDRGKPPPGMPTVERWERLGQNCVRLLGLNPGLHTLTGTNTYLVGQGHTRILVDTGEGKRDYARLLFDVMKEVGCREIRAIVLSHHHFDHTGGIQHILSLFPDIPIFKKADSNREEPYDFTPITNGQEFECEGCTLKAIFTPGHTSDHCCFLLVDDRALLCGDLILGCGSSCFEHYADYIASLRKVKELCGGPEGLKALYPGHGPVVYDPLLQVEEYLTHRSQREGQIMEAMGGRPLVEDELNHVVRDGEGVKPVPLLSSVQITWQVYGYLAPPLFLTAHYNVEQNLCKLLAEGKVNRRRGPMRVHCWELV